MFLLARRPDRRVFSYLAPLADRSLFWSLLALALALPWGTGAAVKVYMDLNGLTTYPWHYYVNPWTFAVYIVPSSIYWSSPLLAALLAWRLAARPQRLLGTTRGDRRIIILAGFLVAAPAAMRLFALLFRDIDNPAVPAGRLPLMYLPYVVAGLLLGGGWVALRVRRRAREARASIISETSPSARA
ncbi:MAG TPA: hypothetical protein VLC48_01610 [Gemmatimonadota bacterium]|nr:hypothetical protein [Gemmatimonadota bacterium]